MAKLVSKVYGDALFEEALEKQEVDALFEEVKSLQNIFATNQDFAGLLDNPKIAKEEKAGIITEVFGGRVSEALMGFLTVIVEKGRQKEINAICDYFISTVKEYKKIGVAHVTSAVELKEEQKAQLLQKLLGTTSYQEFEMDYQVDPSIIGGLMIRIGDRVVDSSIKTQIYELRRSLIKLQIS
ncbi:MULTISPECIES: F0F1 ATP synthase subunit delta [Lacrimispora]|jgi:F-type H+-transporting ATPase subunit delta|uniref:F0F1 ATP synthase subunit delta n=1 Tax=Lacrimispora TaxID=2719231 RepID=UPI000BE39F8A|nr:F0F1 ATP synthase subunit delta [Lacrimispora amygdalina]MDK2966412.1 F-type H+-transporting ATPase subunit delta [Lacrimispora sp.]